MRSMSSSQPTVVVADERSDDDSPEVVVDVDRWHRLALEVLAD
jgi:hypothetical protein